MRPVILSFSGPIASGKTTTSKEVSNILCWKYASFGGFIKKEAIRRGQYPISREMLQDIGIEYIESGWKEFCKAVLNDAQWVRGEGLIIDGIRHIDGLRTIKGIVYPQKVFLIYISINEEIRKQRLRSKNIQIANMSVIEGHSTEIEVREILHHEANLILDGADPLKLNVETIINWLSSQI